MPIVVTAAADMVSLGLVASLPRPGGNLTGSSFFIAELAGKRLELLKQAVPLIVKAAVLLNVDNPSNSLVMEGLEPTAKALNLSLRRFDVHGPADFERTLGAIINQKIGAIVIHEDTVLNANVGVIASAAARHRLPSCGFLEFAMAGGLMAYGVNLPDLDRRAAVFVDKILRGAKPGNLPIERATKFTSIVNLKTAKALGLTIPPSVLARADQVIE